MNIRISKLTLQNFKCFRYKEFSFNDDIVTIKGRNGAGKTTIADAILFCLFGKNTAGQTDFDLKTHDENGITIPNLEHSVELDLLIDNSKHMTLCRKVKEVWVKKRGLSELVFKNNTTEYSINGEVLTATDYKKRVSELVSEDVFRYITNPSYFPSLKWQDQRAFLSKLAGDASDDEIVGDNADFKTLVEILSEFKNDVIAYRKHLSYQIKTVKDKQSKVPVRLEELNKALPEKLDWDAICVQLQEQQRLREDYSNKIALVMAGDTASAEREKRRMKMGELQAVIDRIEDYTRLIIRTKQTEIDRNISASRRKFADTSRTIADLTLKIESYDNLVARCQQTLDECEQTTLEIREKWSENEKSRPQITADLTVCPTCGQPLPDDMAQERINQLTAVFAKNKAKIKEQLRSRAEVTKKLIKDANDQIEEYKRKKEEDNASLASLKVSLNNIQKELHGFEQEKTPGMAELLKDNEEYNNSVAELKVLQDSPFTPSTDNKEVLAEYNACLSQASVNISILTSQLATKSQYDHIQGLISEAEKDKMNLIAQLSELEQQEDIVKAYQSRQNEVLESRINSFFRIVKWKLTRTVNNGGDPFEEPYCECYVDGTAYHDGLNDAAKLNAGLDICETIGRNANTFAPIIIDNAEAVNNILNTTGQQVRLYVSETELQLI